MYLYIKLNTYLMLRVFIYSSNYNSFNIMLVQLSYCHKLWICENDKFTCNCPGVRVLNNYIICKFYILQMLHSRVAARFWPEQFHTTSCCPPTWRLLQQQQSISFMQASFYIIVRNGFSVSFSIRGSSAWWSRAWQPWISRSVCANPTAMLEDSMTSVKTLYTCKSSEQSPTWQHYQKKKKKKKKNPKIQKLS